MAKPSRSRRPRLRLPQLSGPDVPSWAVDLVRGLAALDEDFAPLARLTHSVDQSIADATATLLAFDTGTANNMGGWISTTNTRWVAPVDGFHEGFAAVQWEANATGQRELQVRLTSVTGTSVINSVRADASAAGKHAQVVPWAYEMVDGDYVEVWVIQSSGGPLLVQALSDSPVLVARYVSPVAG